MARASAWNGRRPFSPELGRSRRRIETFACSQSAPPFPHLAVMPCGAPEAAAQLQAQHGRQPGSHSALGKRAGPGPPGQACVKGSSSGCAWGRAQACLLAFGGAAVMFAGTQRQAQWATRQRPIATYLLPLPGADSTRPQSACRHRPASAAGAAALAAGAMPHAPALLLLLLLLGLLQSPPTLLCPLLPLLCPALLRLLLLPPGWRPGSSACSARPAAPRNQTAKPCRLPG